MERDPASAAAEYGAEFRRDIEAFVALEAVMACISPCIFERPKQHYQAYAAFVDPSGGSSDSMTLAIGHQDIARKLVVIDAMRETSPPFSPEAVVQEFAALCKAYSISSVQGDKYAGEWPREAFRRYGISYQVAGKAKSELYQSLLALLNSRRIDLLDNQRLINQLTGLERRTSRAGRDSIDHAPGGHDDLANAVAGLAAINSEFGYTLAPFQPGFRDLDAPPDPAAQQQAGPSAAQFVSTNEWWKALPKRSATTGNPNERLRQLYQSIRGFS
jgi:hypothetical protein